MVAHQWLQHHLLGYVPLLVVLRSLLYCQQHQLLGCKPLLAVLQLLQPQWFLGYQPATQIVPRKSGVAVHLNVHCSSSVELLVALYACVHNCCNWAYFSMSVDRSWTEQRLFAVELLDAFCVSVPACCHCTCLSCIVVCSLSEQQLAVFGLLDVVAADHHPATRLLWLVSSLYQLLTSLPLLSCSPLVAHQFLRRRRPQQRLLGY